MNPVRTLVAALIIALTAIPVTPLAADSGRKAAARLAVPVSGTVDLVGTFTGTLVIQRFVRSGDTVNAVGTLSGTATDAAGVARTVITQVSVPVDLAAMRGGTAGIAPAAISAQAVCDILHLVLGPLDLDLLGLQVHLDQVVLDIVAQSGAGNLLGNLLCAITGLLDGPSPLGDILGQVTTLLNRLLGILG